MSEDNATLDHLESILSRYPDRTSGEDLYQCVRGCSRALVEGNRAAYSDAGRTWISLRCERRTMLAVDLAAQFALSELRPQLEALLADIKGGSFFLPHYAGPVGKALA